MAKGFLKFTAIGNLTRDPELKYTKGGTAIAEIGMACNDGYRNGNGEPVDRVVFGDFVAFGKMAETLQQYLSKGKAFYCEGDVVQDEWDDKETGKKRRATRYHINGFRFIDGNRDGGQPQQRQPARQEAPRQAPASR